ncbi:RecX family transcriptional regulator [Sphingomonas sp. 1P06PA]|uniref:regulatory protein RecX n=1 Tax=Sphingomonas sp. 1P06PA TaxID=554121 RepID=UPI0039A6E8A6
MARPSSNRNRPALDEDGLRALALHYVGRYATTRAKLAAYLTRKLRERGWAGTGAPPIEALVQRIAGLGYVDDRAFAAAREQALARRGFGRRRRSQALSAAGIEPDDRAAVIDADEDPMESALAFARRRRIGPFARAPMDETARRRAFAALMRAGHDPQTASRILQSAPEEFPE